MNRTQNPDHCAADADNGPVVTPADILRGAARYLELHGWTQDSYYDHDSDPAFPAACADGAIGMAAYGRLTTIPGRQIDDPHFALYQRADAYFNDYLHTVGLLTDPDDVYTHGWNDTHGRTAADVIATLRAAADEYDWQHATEDDLETYADICAWREELPDREGFLAWRAAR